MPQLLNICCIFDIAPFERRKAFDILTNAADMWIKPPHSFALYQENGEVAKEGNFFNPDFSLEQRLGETQFLCIYSEFNSEQHRSVVCINEAKGHAIYSLNFPIAYIENTSLSETEKCFAEIFKVANNIGSCVLIAGSEIDAPDPQARLSAISRVFQVNTGVVWLVAKDEDLENYPAGFKIVSKNEGISIVRQSNFQFISDKN